MGNNARENFKKMEKYMQGGLRPPRPLINFSHIICHLGLTKDSIYDIIYLRFSAIKR